MSELLSGKEALIALADGDELEIIFDDGSSGDLCEKFFTLEIFKDKSVKFRLKPQTVKITIEVPKCGASYKPNTYIYVLNSLDPKEYTKIILDESDEVPAYWWRTEEEIKKVVAELRKIKESN